MKASEAFGIHTMEERLRYDEPNTTARDRPTAQVSLFLANPGRLRTFASGSGQRQLENEAKRLRTEDVVMLHQV